MNEDTQDREVEGEHQFGSNDELEDGTDDAEEDGIDDGDPQDGEFEGEHQFGSNDELEDGTDGDEEGEDGDDDGDEQESESNELKAVLSGNGLTAAVAYEEEADETSFEVKVTGGQPDTTLEVSVNGGVVLSFTLDASGVGEFEFSSAPDDVDEQQLPSDFPHLEASDTVAIGDLSGVLEFEEDDD